VGCLKASNDWPIQNTRFGKVPPTTHRCALSRSRVTLIYDQSESAIIIEPSVTTSGQTCLFGLGSVLTRNTTNLSSGKLRTRPGPVAFPVIGGTHAGIVPLVPADGVEEIAVALALIMERLLAQDFLIEMRGQIGKLFERVGILVAVGDAVLFKATCQPQTQPSSRP
jgi:hypothetical protein